MLFSRLRPPRLSLAALALLAASAAPCGAAEIRAVPSPAGGAAVELSGHHRAGRRRQAVGRAGHGAAPPQPPPVEPRGERAGGAGDRRGGAARGPRDGRAGAGRLRLGLRVGVARRHAARHGPGRPCGAPRRLSPPQRRQRRDGGRQCPDRRLPRPARLRRSRHRLPDQRRARRHDLDPARGPAALRHRLRIGLGADGGLRRAPGERFLARPMALAGAIASAAVAAVDRLLGHAPSPTGPR